ncbi:MAG TPA: hypothetical protein PK200_09250 [Spirochaetota bacterium]|nr:hypothetical protein [Spirochaetota bacterium]HQO02693.1 hypothetical protein [Spirochaetota bacterium]HQP47444.1 hypothetical protein [Spirochaetota bacterium]
MATRLFSFRELGLELKTALVFGTLSLILSLVIGIAAGNNFGNALVTSLVLMLVFTGIGYGIILVLRNFVPELLEVFNVRPDVDHTGDAINLNTDQSPEVDGQDSYGEGLEGEDSGVPGDRAGDKDFEPLDRNEMKQYSTGRETSDTKIGKHIVVDQKKIKYEPKIVAEAIRTMMRRDND